MNNLQLYDAWGNLRVIEVFQPVLTRPKLGGGVYETGETGPTTFKLLCDCGYQFDVVKMDFPGKRKLRNCKRPYECEYSRPVVKPIVHRGRIGRPEAPGGPKVMMHSYVTVSLYERIGRHATLAGTSRSQAIVSMLEACLLELYGEGGPKEG